MNCNAFQIEIKKSIEKVYTDYGLHWHREEIIFHCFTRFVQVDSISCSFYIKTGDYWHSTTMLQVLQIIIQCFVLTHFLLQMHKLVFSIFRRNFNFVFRLILKLFHVCVVLELKCLCYFTMEIEINRYIIKIMNHFIAFNV